MPVSDSSQQDRELDRFKAYLTHPDQTPGMLRQTIKDFCDAIEHLEDGLALVAEDGRLMACNRAARRWHGDETETARPGTPLHAPGDDEERSGQRDRAAQTQRTKHGTKVIRYCNVGPPAGTPEELIAAQERLNAIMDNIPFDVALKDAKGRYTLVNRRYTEIFGLTTKDVQGKLPSDIHGAEMARSAHQQDLDVLATGEVVEIAETYRQENGEFQILTTKFPIRDKAGAITGVGGVSVDVTNLMRAERDLRETQTLLANIAANVPGVMFRRVSKTDGGVAYPYISGGVGELIGERPQRLKSDAEWFEENIHPDDRSSLPTHAGQDIEDGQTLDFEYRALTPAHETKWVHLINRAWRMANGDLACDGIALDITRQKRDQEALVRANQELSQYTHVVSHDLKTPLRAIHSYADFLTEDLGDSLSGELMTYFTGMKRAVQQSEDMIEDLLTISRVGRADAPTETIDLTTFIDNLVVPFRLNAAIDLRLPAQWPRIEASPFLLREVLQNLLTNAAKFNDREARLVELQWRLVGGHGIEISVRDNGIGMEKRHLGQIFNIFERLHPSEMYDGTGIGLAVVEKALAHMGGTIDVQSTVGQGSCFSVTLPNVIESAVENPASEA